MNKIRVTFHRTYEIEEKDVLDRLEDFNLPEDYKFSDEEIKEEAQLIAVDYLADEMPYFENNLNDFVSSTVEIIGSE